MDVIQILRNATEKLPEAEYSNGLRAIIRHLESAIRHYLRDPLEEPDCYTDSIYRTNQAYEGSLKEAYRVLAQKDPAGKTPNEIEIYFEQNKVLRPRVLVQLSRYRKDYRNPSTHDYRLDFDANESLLSIVSVTAFCKLLVDQISEKLAFNESFSKESITKIPSNGTARQFCFRVAEYIRDRCNENDHIDLYDSEFEASIAGSLASAGVETDTNYESESAWDILAWAGDKRIAIETRVGDNRHGTSRLIPINYLWSGIRDESLDGGIIITRVKQKGNYAVLKIIHKDGDMFPVVTKLDKNTVQERLGQGWGVEL